MQLRLGPCLTLTLLVASAGALVTGCGSSGSGSDGSGGTGTGGAGVGGSSATGGQGGTGGGAGGTGGAAGGSGGAAGSSTGGMAGAAGGGGSGGAPPMCSTSAECKEAAVSFPGNTSAPTAMPTACVGGQCGLVTSYSGSYKAPKAPKSCTEICAASTYEGQAMKCSASCQTKTVNGFGDKGLVFDAGADAGVGSVAGLVMYQFSSLSGAYEFLEVGCAEIPKSKLIKGSNSYTYVSHGCCCVAP